MSTSSIEEIVQRAERGGESWEDFCSWLMARHPALAQEMLDDSPTDWRFLLPIAPDARVLELGCGWGNLSLCLADSCSVAHAVDTDAMHIRWAAARAKMTGVRNVLVSLADLGAPVPPPGFFDLIVVQDLRWILPDCHPASRISSNAVLRALSMLKDVLNPGGILVLGLESPYLRQGARRYLFSALAAFQHPAVRRVQDALRRLGLEWTRAFLALPSCKTSAYLLDVATPGSLGPALRFFAAHFIEPRNLKRLAGRWALLHAPLASVYLESVAGCWLFAASGPPGGGLGEVGGAPWLEADDDHSPRLRTMVIKGNADRHSRVHLATFEERSGRGRSLIHIARSLEEPHVITREHDNLCLIREKLSVPMKATVPSPIGLGEVHGRPAIALQWVDGQRLSDRLRKVTKVQGLRAVSSLFPAIIAWLVRFQKEMGSFTHFDDELLGKHIVAPIETFIAGCNPASELAAHARRLVTEAEAFLGQQVLLTAEHGDLWHRNILLRAGAISPLDQVRVTDWELASFGQLPFADFYSLVISTALLLLGDDAAMLRGRYALKYAYSGKSRFSRLIDVHLEEYAAQIDMDRRWGAILFPLSHLKVATLHQVYFRDALAPKWMEMAEFCLCHPNELPVAMGRRANVNLAKPRSLA